MDPFKPRLKKNHDAKLFKFKGPRRPEPNVSKGSSKAKEAVAPPKRGFTV